MNDGVMVAEDDGGDVAARLAMIAGWLRARLPAPGHAWFDATLPTLRGDADRLAIATGLAPRKLGKAGLALTDTELARARDLCPGFDATGWGVDQAARAAFALAGWDGDADRYAALLREVLHSAGIGEAIALYRAWPLYGGAAALEGLAREAVRSAMRPVFEAIAHRNPYPVEWFDEAAWNQMIVKTFFLESPLWPIQGIERRANPALAAILLDLVRERRAAGRPVSPELWRCVAPHAGGAGLAAMRQVLEEGTETERLGVALSLRYAGGADADLLRRECERQGLAHRVAAAAWPTLSPWTDAYQPIERRNAP